MAEAIEAVVKRAIYISEMSQTCDCYWPTTLIFKLPYSVIGLLSVDIKAFLLCDCSPALIFKVLLCDWPAIEAVLLCDWPLT